MNNLEFAFTLNTNGLNSLDAWASDTGRPPAVQIQESEVMQVASLCDTVQPVLAGSGHISVLFPRMMPLSYNCLNWS